MYITLHCIALTTVRHSDTRVLLRAWSREHGAVTFALPAGKGRGATRTRALTMPMGRFEGVSDVGAPSSPRKEILYIRDLTLSKSNTERGMRFTGDNPIISPVKQMVAGILAVILRGVEADEAMDAYLNRAIDSLENTTQRGVANFIDFFLFGLARYMGIMPDLREPGVGEVFDMREARFRHTQPLHGDYVAWPWSQWVWKLGRMNFDNFHHFKFTRQQRREIYDYLSRYYCYHLSINSIGPNPEWIF